MQNFANQLGLDLLTDGNARTLLNVVADDKQNQLIQDLSAGGMSPQDLVDFIGTREFLALLSLTFNGIPPVVRDKQTGQYLSNTKMLNAMLEGKRAEAWYEIRYNSNGNDLPGLAKRRFFEADTFGLYTAGTTSSTITDTEAKSVFRMYTSHRDGINEYESRYGLGGSRGDRVLQANNDYQLTTDRVDYWSQESQIARQHLVTSYAQGRPIDGEVLVGRDTPPALAVTEKIQGTSQADLIFGEGGMDRLEGFSGADVLYGGAGSDTLRGGFDGDLLVGDAGFDVLEGGLGNDELRGGADFDTYVYHSGEGQDTITDSDGLGVIEFDGQALVGGIRRAGDPADTWKSAEGTVSFLKSGTDLLIQTQGQTALTVQSYFLAASPTFDPLGIRLSDLTALPTGTAPVINYTNGLPDDTLILDNQDSNGVGPLGGTGALSRNTTVFANGGNDWVFINPGNVGNNQMFGGTGHDLLEAAQGQDRLFGEAGRDLLFGFAGDDVLEGGADEDLLQGSAGQDVLDGGAGDDALNGGGGNDLLRGGTEGDVLFGDALDTPTSEMGRDYVEGDGGADWLFGLLQDDTLVGGDQADHLYGDTVPTTSPAFTYTWPGGITPDTAASFASFAGGNDFLDGGTGDDVLQGDGGADTLLGGVGMDTLYGDDPAIGQVDEQADWLDGGTENDTLFGGGGGDTLLGGDGDDTLVGDFADDPVGGDDVLDGGAGNDTLVGARGNDTLFGAADQDLLLGDDGQDFLDGGAGEDELQGGSGEDTLFGGADDDLLFGEAGTDTLYGGAGDDELQGGGDGDVLSGDAGADRLFGEDGEDTLIGDADDDILAGGPGADTYVFNKGDGTDTIDDTSGDANRLVFGTGISADSLALGQGSLRIIVAETGDELHILNFDPTDPLAVNPISTFEFQDGTVLTANDLVAQGFDLIGTPGIDFLSGGEVYARIFGIGGDDTLTGGSGDNLLDGGAGPRSTPAQRNQTNSDFCALVCG